MAFIAMCVLLAGLLGTNVSAQSGLGQTQGLASGYGANTSTCAIETVGWVICPVMRSIAKLADYGFAFINQTYLRIEYALFNNDSGVYKAWELMRNVANASFVIAFMVVIYSQITGRNSGGYNIKRMLPRLIVGAIFVNISYYACVLVIDVANIVGDSTLSIMKDVTNQIGTAAMTLDSAENGFDDSRLSDITSGILTKSGTVWILLAPVAAITIAIAVICAAGLVLLIMRKVIVDMLILASPLVFVAYLLPNLERYFQDWLRLFLQLLLLYPIVAFLLGTGQIISATIINVGSGGENYSVRDDSYQGRNGGSGSATTDLAAAGAAVLPLLGVWFLLKNVTSLATNAGSRISDAARARSSKSEEEKVKAKMNNKNQPMAGVGAGLPSFGGRRPAFSRLSRKRKSTAGGSSLTGDGSTGKPGGASIPGRAAGATTPSTLLDNMMGLGKGDKKAEAATEAAKKMEEVNGNAAVAEAANLNAQVAAAVKGGDDKKGKSAKDIFNNMNKGHQSKDQQRSLSGGGPAPAGQPQAGSTPTAPSSEYRAPAITQSHGTQPAAGQAPAQPTVIAIPVQVDAATFLPQQNQPMAGAAMQHPPSSEIEQKAKARAQRYLFDSAEGGADEQQKREDILNPNRPAADQPPHIEVPRDKK